MIHQFAELGRYYRQREGVGNSEKDQLRLYAHDPAQKFRTRNVLLLVFAEKGFDRVQVEQYDDSKRLLYLYRPGPPNGWDATPTSGLRQVKKKTQGELDKSFTEEVRKKLARLGRAVADGLQNGDDLQGDEKRSLEKVRDVLLSTAEDAVGGRSRLGKIVKEIQVYLPPETKKNAIVSLDAIISIALRTDKGNIKRVGDFETFRQLLVRQGKQSFSRKRTIKGDVKGIGQCCICGKNNMEVSGLLKIFHPPLYTIDRPGSVSGGFNRLNAWRNFPACSECREQVDFAGERVKKNLIFKYYGFQYMVLPSPVQPVPTLAYEFLDRLMIAATVNHEDKGHLMAAAENDILYVIAQEKNVFQVDLLFYKNDLKYFRPALYISGLLPLRFRKLFDAKDRVDVHPWLNDPSPKTFAKNKFTFGSFRNVAEGFDDDFLAATRAALELRQFSTKRLLQLGMQGVQQDYKGGKAWQFRLADLFRCLLFFEILANQNTERSETHMDVDYGYSEQATRVRKVLSQASGRLRDDPVAQAVFLVGACCSRIENIQLHARQDQKMTPFSGKLKGFRLNQRDVLSLFVAAKDKAKVYGSDEERKVNGLLECAAAALAATPERWPLSADEVSYYFALGHALRPRFAKDAEENSISVKP